MNKLIILLLLLVGCKSTNEPSWYEPCFEENMEDCGK